MGDEGMKWIVEAILYGVFIVMLTAGIFTLGVILWTIVVP